MSESDDVLISVHARHLHNLLTGKKSVELRRRRVRLSPPTRVWLYGTRPIARLGAVGLIERVEIAEPKQIWLKHGQHAAISECEFEEYFKGAKIGTAIVFRKVLPITQSIGLQEIRDQLGEFYPPQFMRRLHRDAPELAMFNAALEPAS